MTNEKECINCGKCCYHHIGGGKLVKCPYLIILPSGKSRCRIYNSRLKTKIKIEGKTFYCVYYSEVKHEIEGCSLNTGNKLLKIVEISGKRGIIKDV